MVPGTCFNKPGPWLQTAQGAIYLDQGYHYDIPSVRSNYNENILLLTEGYLGQPEVAYYLKINCKIKFD